MVERQVEKLASSLRLKTLVFRDGEQVHVWFGRWDPIGPTKTKAIVNHKWPAQWAVSIGEEGRGPSGFRMTYQQSRAAHQVARVGPDRVVHYREVGLVASLLEDELLVNSLSETLLKPIAEADVTGGQLTATLRTYFASARNASSAAAKRA